MEKIIIFKEVHQRWNSSWRVSVSWSREVQNFVLAGKLTEWTEQSTCKATAHTGSSCLTFTVEKVIAQDNWGSPAERPTCAKHWPWGYKQTGCEKLCMAWDWQLGWGGQPWQRRGGWRLIRIIPSVETGSYRYVGSALLLPVTLKCNFPSGNNL